MDDEGKAHKAGERVAKVIARAGLASRREAEQWIAAGRVAVNGAVIASAACNVTARDHISVDGKPLPAKERTRLFLYNKPRGLMTTHADPQGRPTIFQRLPQTLPRLISVGRLDFNTEGLLLLTNDGALARVLELPATGWLRRYRVRAHGTVTQDQLEELRAGVTISGIRYAAIEAALDRVQGSNLWLTFAIREGKNREVRNVLGHLGLVVTRLIRLSFGPFPLGELAEGAVEEVRTRVLREQLGARLVALAGADFSMPIAATPPPRQQREDTRDGAPHRKQRKDTRDATPRRQRREDASDTKPPRQQPQPARDGTRPKPKNHKPASHAWRAYNEERAPKKLLRTFRGSRHDADMPRPKPTGAPRPGVLADRKGRSIPIERFGEAPPRKDKKEASKRGQFGRRGAPDRAAGPRPRHSRGRH